MSLCGFPNVNRHLTVTQIATAKHYILNEQEQQRTTVSEVQCNAMSGPARQLILPSPHFFFNINFRVSCFIVKLKRR